MSDSIYALESQDGLRCTWQNWPNNKTASSRNVIPISIVYTPRKEIESLSLVEYDPVPCSKCKCILNPHCPVDYSSKVWACPICLTRNAFPPSYKAHISETTIPTELMPSSTTIEYILPNPATFPPIFVFVVDTCCSQEELMTLKSSLQQSLNLLPAESLIGFISFGKNAYLYNLTWADCGRCFAFRGDKKYELGMIKEQLGLSGTDPRSVLSSARKFLVPACECEFNLNGIIEGLKKDPWIIPAGNRPLRCTGTALMIALTLLELAYPKQGARVLLFASGACTFGSGLVVSENLNDCIRTQHDVKNEKAKYLKESSLFYESLSQKAILNSHCVDILCCSIDQIGIFEMKSLSEKTGGYMVLTDTYKSDVFTYSLRKIFARDVTGALQIGFNSTISVLTSPDLKINGAIGAGFSTKLKNEYVSEVEIGMGQSSEWGLANIDSQTSIAYYLDLVNAEEGKRQYAHVQFQTKYQHSSGRVRLRVTSAKYPYVDSNNLSLLIAGFDQETAAVIMSRWAVFKCESENPIDVTRWIDRTLIRLVKKFAEFTPDVPNSFRLCKEFSLYPQFMFHLRRSHFLQSFNVSPDESAYYKLLLMRENVTNCLLMIQPALLEYSFDSPMPRPVLLDIVSLKNNVILLLDTFFNVLIWHGEMVSKWIKLGYLEKEGYEHFATLLQMPRDDAGIIMATRFPVPKIQETECGKGPERILKARVNPSGGGIGNSTVDGGNYFTEDVSLKVFMDSLIQYAVKG